MNNRILLGLSVLLLLFTLDVLWAAEQETCIQCHSDKNFYVTNKKLYDYFQEWDASIHHQEEVTCSDCHGGNPNKKTKQAAHGGKSGTTKLQNAVNFKNIPKTCGQCHDDIYDSYVKSNHYNHLIAKKQTQQGPNCVTCHGSLNATALNVNTVKKTCINCHNDQTGNHPEIPDKAEWLLNKFLSVSRFYRYVRIKGDPKKIHDYLITMDQKITDLSVNWHMFNLKRFEQDTRAVLDSLKEKRNQVKQKQKRKQ